MDFELTLNDACDVLQRVAVQGNVSRPFRSKHVGQQSRMAPVMPVTTVAAAAGADNAVSSNLHAESVDVREAEPVQEREYKVADMEDLLRERDACGVGIIAKKTNEASHEVVNKSLQALGCMEHRGACSADNDSGDGSGIMTQIPWKLFNAWAKEQGLSDFDPKSTAVGMIFIPDNDEAEVLSKSLMEQALKEEGLDVLAWREVPVDRSIVGAYAKETEPRFWQVFAKTTSGETGDDLERTLFFARRRAEKLALEDQLTAENFYICTLSSRTIVYKGMLRAAVLGTFYLDLQNELYESSFSIYHRRFSTNTNPRWPFAQPFRMLGHNGEINTLLGNLNWQTARESHLESDLYRGRESDLFPIIAPTASDSANLDRSIELMARAGRKLEEAMMILVPEAYNNHPVLDRNCPKVRAFYDFYSGLQEGWDGPALLIFSDGKTIGARLDRNGLRPARFWETSDGTVYVASEAGVFDDVFESAPDIIYKGRLGPGEMVVVDLETGEFLDPVAGPNRVANEQPYEEWNKRARRLRALNDFVKFDYLPQPAMNEAELLCRSCSNGYSAEDVQMVIETMAAEGREATFCMGDDIPLAVMSEKPHLVYDYFKQRFAQVTNPPIDPLREGLVVSLEMKVGLRGNLLKPGPDAVDGQVKIRSPVLIEHELEGLMVDDRLNAEKLYMSYDANTKGSMKTEIEKLCEEAAKKVKAGCRLLVLSDNFPSEQLSPDRPAIPALLAVGAVHHYLIKKGLRMDASIVTETAQAFNTHHFAVLIGYGASAVCPYLALEQCRHWRMSKKTLTNIKRGKIPDLSIEDAQRNFRNAITSGIKKILSKMGISLLSTYHGAQILEIYGLSQDVVDLCFCGSVSRIGGLTLDELAEETTSFWQSGFPSTTKLDNFGFIQSRPSGEYHANNPELSKLLHKAVRSGEQDKYQLYADHLDKRTPSVLRDLLEFKSDRQPIPIEEVEPASQIVARFCTGGMSLGAISRETHETIAIAVNRIGAKSNSGEGGEDPTRYEVLSDVDEEGRSPTFPHLKGLQNSDTARSGIKQVASGRFGVTPHFLRNASQLEIKIAQGAKPGEGGQLPGPKVSPYIASLRRSKPGVPLISPPPHHDIYSIEDLAQLIYDLHQVNEEAKVSVKLVAEVGIGTIASGVAKANADIIQISGHDGGTGASPVSSIKHAGGPLEMGLAETHTTLLENGLRERVVIRADGGLKSGRDVMMSAALGADEFGFGTVAMIATGCIMARICHTNNCPVGVASQREELRAKFPGVPSDLVNFFLFVAEEVRTELARLGYKSLSDIVGRTDLLTAKASAPQLPKTSGIDLSFLTKFVGPAGSSQARIDQPTHSNGPVLDDIILADSEVQDAIVNEHKVEKEYHIVNTDRSVGGRVSGEIASRHGDLCFAGEVSLRFNGSAGQSFGCFLCHGVKIHLIGEANDYVGKGMAGGEIVLVPPSNLGVPADTASIAGNTCLYGATGGSLFVNGRAGERFAVRNSMAEAVVEGTGDHACEYMTGGCVVVLGSVGRNVGAGMTGGLAYFYDEDGNFEPLVNREIVTVQRVCTAAGETQLRRMIQSHFEKTGSLKAKSILDDWATALPKFWQLVPPSEANTPEASPEVVESTIAQAA